MNKAMRMKVMKMIKELPSLCLGYRPRKIMGINIRLFCISRLDTKNFFDPKRTKIKTSSLLNASNDSSKNEEFSLKDIEVFVERG